MEKELTIYDDLALAFAKILKKHGITYVFVSGYVAILFGRSRTSEDIDILVKKIPYPKFVLLWKSLLKTFYCHNTDNVRSAYYEYLGDKLALRFSLKNAMIPNIEFKWASTSQHKRALSDNITVSVSGRNMVISSLEIQIAFKLYLGSEKDIEDARYLFELFRQRIDTEMLKREIAVLGISERKAMRLLGW